MLQFLDPIEKVIINRYNAIGTFQTMIFLVQPRISNYLSIRPGVCV